MALIQGDLRHHQGWGGLQGARAPAPGGLWQEWVGLCGQDGFLAWGSQRRRDGGLGHQVGARPEARLLLRKWADTAWIARLALVLENVAPRAFPPPPIPPRAGSEQA